MIDRRNNPVAWALLLSELDDARKHLEALIERMNQDGATDENEFAVDMAHIYAHLNRAWHSRNQDEEIRNEQWVAFSAFPGDLEPVG